MSGYSYGTPSRAACPALKARDIALSTGPFCCGVYGAVNSRRIPRPLQKSTNILFECSVSLSVRNARWIPMSATKHFTTERMAAALFSPTPYGRCRREALSTNITTDGSRPPKRSWVRPSGVDMDKSQRLRRSPRRVMWGRCSMAFCSRTSRT